ncbi:MAG: hypothetical protein EOS81_36585, partial [Mesorhizobium sp.]
AMPSGGGDWTAALRNENGLVDPEKVSAAAFASVNDALDAVREDSIRQIDLHNVEFELPDTGLVKRVTVTSATVAQTGTGRMQFSYDADVDGRHATLTATATRDATARRIASLDANIEIEGAGTSGEGGSTEAAPAADGARLGSIALQLSGSEASGDSPSRLAASLSLTGSVLDLDERGLLPLDVDADATLMAGSNKISVDRLLIKNGRSSFDFAGSIGPKPAAAGEEPAYRYDLTSDGSTLAPSESPEPALQFLARIAGVYQPKSRKLVAEQIGVRSGGSGEVLGAATVAFVDNGPPGVSLSLNVHDMPVSHVKQLWPWFSARNARLWVLGNLFGGTV